MPMTICINPTQHLRPHKLPCRDCAEHCGPGQTIDLSQPTYGQLLHRVNPPRPDA
jgi:hypothetical protein